jgi:hypothetical protein
VSVCGVSNGRHTVTQTAEPLVTQPSAIKLEIITAKLEIYESLGADQITAEVIQLGCRTISSEIHQLGNSLWNKKKLTQRRKESIIVPFCTNGDETDCSNC